MEENSTNKHKITPAEADQEEGPSVQVSENVSEEIIINQDESIKEVSDTQKMSSFKYTEVSMLNNGVDSDCAEALAESKARDDNEKASHHQQNHEESSSQVSEDRQSVDPDVEDSAYFKDFPVEDDSEEKVEEDKTYFNTKFSQSNSRIDFDTETEMEKGSTELKFSGYKKVNPAYQFCEKDVKDWADKAIQKRLGIFIGTDQHIITAAIDAVLKHPTLDNHKSLCIENLRNKNSVFSILHAFKMLTKECVNSILIVEAHGAVQDRVIDSLLHLYEGVFRNHRQQLISCECLLLFGCQRDYLIGEEKLVKLENIGHFLTVSIPEVEALIYTRFPKDAKKLLSEADNEIIRPGPSLEDLIRRLKNANSSAEAKRELCPETNEDHSSKDKLIQELDQGNLLYAAPAYVAAFFPGAYYRDYQQLVGTLLESEVQKKDVIEIVTDSEGKYFEKRVNIEVKLEQEWRQRRIKLLRECVIRQERSSSNLEKDDFLMEDLSDPTIAFRDISIQRNIRRLFLTDYFDFHNLFFEKIIEVGLLFTASSHLAEKIVMLAIQSAAANLRKHPSRVGEIVIQVAFGGKVSDVRFSDYEVHIRLERLAMLFKGLFSREPLRHPAEKALNAFMENRQFEFVHQLLSRISNIDGLDTLKWRKRLIEEGDPATSGQISYRMYNGLFNNKNFSLEVFDTLTDWIPDLTDQAVSKANQIAVYAAILMCEISLTPLANMHQREWIIRAMEQFYSEHHRMQERLEQLIRWLYHPGAIEYFQSPQTVGKSILKDKTVQEIAFRLKRINPDINIDDFLPPVQPWRLCFSSYIQDICISEEAWQFIIEYGDSDALLQEINRVWSEHFSLSKSKTGDRYIFEVAQSLTLFEWCRKLNDVNDVRGLELIAEIARQALTTQQQNRASVYWRAVSLTLLLVKSALYNLQGIKGIETGRRIRELGNMIDKQRSSFSRIEREFLTPKQTVKG